MSEDSISATSISSGNDASEKSPTWHNHEDQGVKRRRISGSTQDSLPSSRKSSQVSPGQINDHTEPSSSSSLDRTIISLRNKVEASKAVLSRFRGDFINETLQILPYATPDILRQLRACKVERYNGQSLVIRPSKDQRVDASRSEECLREAIHGLLDSIQEGIDVTETIEDIRAYNNLCEFYTEIYTQMLPRINNDPSIMDTLLARLETLSSLVGRLHGPQRGFDDVRRYGLFIRTVGEFREVYPKDPG